MSTTRDTTHLSDPSKFKLESDGTFKRPATVFRNSIEKGGTFEPEAGERPFWRLSSSELLTHTILDRYHLYVSYACR